MSKRDDRRGDEGASKKGDAFGNPKLREALGQWKKTQAPAPSPATAPSKAQPKSPPKPPPPPPGRRKAAESVDDDEGDAYFRMAMTEVDQLPEDTRLPPRTETPLPPMLDEDAEALARLAELVSTGEGFDIADTDEYIEGAAQGIDGSLLARLRRGDFSVQAHLDLHGFLADDAKAELERFLVDSRRAGRRCVLVIHGRGKHSKDQEPILKTKVGAWLSRGRLARMVLAFATARPVDGGAGALYVLIRR